MATSLAKNKAAYTRTGPGGAGLKSMDVNQFAGFLTPSSCQTTIVDWTGGGATTNLFVAPFDGRIVQAFALVTTAVTNGDGSLRVGSLKYTSGSLVANATKYASVTPTASSPVGTLLPLTLASDLTFVQGEIITAGYTTKTGAGQGLIVVLYTLDDFNPRKQ